MDRHIYSIIQRVTFKTNHKIKIVYLKSLTDILLYYFNQKL
jgi:hypothetical protein